MESDSERMQDRLDCEPKSMRVRRATVEHPFGTLKAWMGATHFKTSTLEKVRTEMSLRILANNLKRVIAILGTRVVVNGRFGVSPRKSRDGHMFSGMPPIAAGSEPRMHLQSAPMCVAITLAFIHLARAHAQS
jgi:Transposase DDE domain